MIDLQIDLIVEARQRRVDQVVVDRLAVRSDGAAGVRFGNDLREHRDIVQAIRGGAVLQARAAMRRHLVNSRKRYQRLAAKLGSG